MKRTLCWMRRDLRLHDHRALSEATHSGACVVTFVFDTKILEELKPHDRRITYIHGCLEVLDQSLKEMGSRLIVLVGDPVEEIPKLAKRLNIDAVFANEDYEPYAKKRDAKVKEELAASGVPLNLFKDHVIFSGKEIMNRQGMPYRVFTPYSRTWKERLSPVEWVEFKPDLREIVPQRDLLSEPSLPSLHDLGFESQDLIFEPGFVAGHERLSTFLDYVDQYHESRDYLYPVKTSTLSIDLRFGTLSIRELVREVVETASLGPESWLRQLIWRDFYQMILDQFPYVEKTCFKPEFDSVAWPDNPEFFEAWKEGRTGFTLIDMAMVQLKETGWMHNRLRMITASFLVKDLLVDWRKGERWFAEQLLDFDLASNNGGWQWCAGTGVDAMPWFRIFNPDTQAAKWDPQGTYQKTMLHEFGSEFKERGRPPHPIVDHREQVKAFKQLMEASKRSY